MRRLLVVAVALIALWPGAALADTVTSTADSGAGTLRAAVANGGTVTFAPALGQITLSSPIVVSSPGLTISDPEGDVNVTGASPLLHFSAGNALVAGVNFRGTGGGSAIQVDGGVTGVKIERSPIFNVATPIALASGANGDIAPPQSVRVGPRQPDGTLPVTGTVAAGAEVDVYGGDPTGSTPTRFLGRGDTGGGTFTLVPSPEPAPGAKVTATITSPSAGLGTSNHSATATVPADVTSPTLAGAFAFSTSEVIVVPSEPLAAGSLNLSDFSLEMAGVPRAITQGGISPDGSRVYLISNQPWNPGEAGSLSLAGAGRFTDLAGNWNLGSSPLAVGAAPGDFSPPLVQSLKLTPSKVCLTSGKTCKHIGVTISFVTNEVGKAVVVVNRASNRRAGQFVKKVTKAGRVKITWRGTIHGRKLRAGRYVVEVSMEDNVGNVTDSPPFQAIHIVRTTR
ncbi:MAG TPA: hypothetical protein VGI67_17485 [Thermoleophilaceae bacterium]